jgi:hypothetical protein
MATQSSRVGSTRGPSTPRSACLSQDVDAKQQPVFQAEASLSSQRNVFQPKRHPWWAWVVLLAWVGILFVLAMLFVLLSVGETGGSTRSSVQADRIYTEGR